MLNHIAVLAKTLRIMDMIFITYCTAPSFLAALYTYFAGETGIVVFWTFGYNIIEGKYKVLVNFIGGLMYYTVYMEFPCFACLSVCVLVHHYELLLRDFHDDLKKESSRRSGIYHDFGTIHIRINWCSALDIADSLLFRDSWYMIKIKSTLAAIIDRHQVRDLTLGREIRLLERMERKK
ncbi:hypothetical protein CEXT_328511 [Caerostris extrusa]|uniref:Uncharacterized protein n=1 Tax=Caerostris extrusa TaxID=172846 RepID=A0AAV4TSX0_CAEEX|nr:hypothetical protein CEXT_328511 [Caerostris extrusa]